MYQSQRSQEKKCAQKQQREISEEALCNWGWGWVGRFGICDG